MQCCFSVAKQTIVWGNHHNQSTRVDINPGLALSSGKRSHNHGESPSMMGNWQRFQRCVAPSMPTQKKKNELRQETKIKNQVPNSE